MLLNFTTFPIIYPATIWHVMYKFTWFNVSMATKFGQGWFAIFFYYYYYFLRF